MNAGPRRARPRRLPRVERPRRASRPSASRGWPPSGSSPTTSRARTRRRPDVARDRLDGLRRDHRQEPATRAAPTAADNVYEMWKASPPHRAIMFSGTYNYVGIGVAQAADGTDLGGRDHDRVAGPHRAGGPQPVAHPERQATWSFTWSGSDPRLQTHTAGLRSFDVQMRRRRRHLAHGPRQHDERPGRVFPDRARGHWYGFRVQAADRRGNALAVDQRDPDLGAVAPAPGDPHVPGGSAAAWSSPPST